MRFVSQTGIRHFEPHSMQAESVCVPTRKPASRNFCAAVCRSLTPFGKQSVSISSLP